MFSSLQIISCKLPSAINWKKQNEGIKKRIVLTPLTWIEEGTWQGFIGNSQQASLVQSLAKSSTIGDGGWKTPLLDRQVAATVGFLSAKEAGRRGRRARGRGFVASSTWKNHNEVFHAGFGM
jgi:hypothetical protein